MSKIYSSMRTAIIRITMLNELNKDNAKLGLKAGDKVIYKKTDIIQTLEDWAKNKKMKYYMIEHNENLDNIHYHIVVWFDSPTSFNAIKAKFPYGDIEKCKYGIKNCVQYLVHMNDVNKFQYSWDDVVSNAPEKVEIYKIPSKATTDAILQSIIDKIITGEIKGHETEKIDYNIYIKYKRKLKDAFEYRQLLMANNPNRNLQVIVCQGPPRVGKSLFAKVYAEKNNKSICFSSSSNDPWQEYRGEDIFVYDDFNYTQNKIEDLLKALDPHNLTSVSARYKNRLFVGDTIFICTNTNIAEWYTWALSDHRKALFARIACVLEFIDIENGISHYTVNDIIDSGKWDSTTNSRNLVDNVYARMVLSRRDDRIREFNLNNYINIHADDNKANDFISQLDEI